MDKHLHLQQTNKGDDAYAHLVDPLISIGTELKNNGYSFRTITPNSHTRVLARNKPISAALNNLGVLRDFFGWNLASTLDGATTFPKITDALEKGKLIKREQEGLKSAVRFSTYSENTSCPLIFAHSTFPTTESDSVFFGPDTYRYFNFIRNFIHQYYKPNAVTDRRVRTIDVGAGSGAGGLFLAKELMQFKTLQLDVILSDINSKALFFSKANTITNFFSGTGSHPSNIDFYFTESNLYASITGGPLDIIISNPPYMVDSDADSRSAPTHDGASRLYRDGGGTRGIDLAVRIVREGLDNLNKGGYMAIYTGVPILEGGEDPFIKEIRAIMAGSESVQLVEYEEIDPDVWGEELEGRAYADVERIAVVGLILRKM